MYHPHCKSYLQRTFSKVCKYLTVNKRIIDVSHLHTTSDKYQLNYMQYISLSFGKRNKKQSRAYYVVNQNLRNSKFESDLNELLLFVYLRFEFINRFLSKGILFYFLTTKLTSPFFSKNACKIELQFCQNSCRCMCTVSN